MNPKQKQSCNKLRKKGSAISDDELSEITPSTLTATRNSAVMGKDKTQVTGIGSDPDYMGDKESSSKG